MLLLTLFPMEAFLTPWIVLWRQSEKMIQEGASIIDVGGESTRPGAVSVATQQEVDRVLPVIDAIKRRFDIIVSVDTSTAEVDSRGCGFRCRFN